jgi:hypothetical protein
MTTLIPLNQPITGNTALRTFMSRCIFGWLFIILVYLFARNLLFTGVSEYPANGYLVTHRPAWMNKSLYPIGLDILLTTACLVFTVVPRWWILPPVTGFLLGILLSSCYVLSITEAWIFYWIFALTLPFTITSEKAFIKVWNIYRLLCAMAFVVAFVWITPVFLRRWWGNWSLLAGWIPALFATWLYYRKGYGIALYLLLGAWLAAAVLLLHLNLPWIMCTIIFAPFINWTNLHKFFVKRFIPQ